MLCNRLKALIFELGVKKGDFSEKIGFSQAYVSMILSGKRQKPTERFFESVQREFKVNPSWLKDGSGDMYQSHDSPFSSDDEILLKKYMTLTLAERQIVDEVLDALVIKRLYELQCRKS